MIDENNALYKYYPMGDIYNKDISFYKLAITKIIRLHEIDIRNFKKLKVLNDKYYEELVSNLQNVKLLSVSTTSLLKESIPLFTSSMCLIHDDYLPFNVIVTSQNNVLITDFATISVGFKERDIGRFLGDINCKTENSSDRYYPKEWYQILVDFYCSLMARKDKNIDIKEVIYKTELGQLLNYCEIIETNIKNNNCSSDWVKKNIMESEKLTCKIQKRLCKN